MRAFFSYPREIKSLVDQVYMRVRQSSPAVWMDCVPAPYVDVSIPAGAEWAPFIYQKISECELFVPFFTEREIDKDRFFAEELKCAFRNLNNKINPTLILPVLVNISTAPKLDAEMDFGKFQWMDWSNLGVRGVADSVVGHLGVSEAIEEISVASGEELLSVIGGNRRIALAEGDYDITDKPGGISYAKYLRREKVHDGSQFVFTGLKNLTISGRGEKRPHVYVRPSYAFAFAFRDCQNIVIDGLNVGHHPKQGYCQGGVIEMVDCNNIQVLNSRLYGCGTVGAEIKNSESVALINCAIEECTYGFVTMENSVGVLIDSTNIARNRVYFGVSVSGCDRVTIRNCKFEQNETQSPEEPVDSVSCDNSTNIVIEKTTFLDTAFRADFSGNPDIVRKP